MIWHAVLALAAKDEVVLVSADGDFGDDELHPHLVYDLKARGIARERVRLYGSIEDAVRALFAPAEALVEELNVRLRETRNSTIVWSTSCARRVTTALSSTSTSTSRPTPTPTPTQ